MKPSEKLNATAFTLATLIVFSLWTSLPSIVVIIPSLKVLLGGLVSLASYRLMVKTLQELAKRIIWIKKIFLGPAYLGGTWIGFYIGTTGKVRYIIERFEQDMDSLVIRGKSFNHHSLYHAQWNASSVNIDILNGRISYMYECLPINDNSNGNGIAIFNFERDDQYSPAKLLTGFSSDLHIGKRAKAFEIKISSRCDIPENEALMKAKEFYEGTKARF